MGFLSVSSPSRSALCLALTALSFAIGCADETPPLPIFDGGEITVPDRGSPVLFNDRQVTPELLPDEGIPLIDGSTPVPLIDQAPPEMDAAPPPPDQLPPVGECDDERPCGPGERCVAGSCVPDESAVERCDLDGDEDLDGLADCDDPDCANALRCSMDPPPADPGVACEEALIVPIEGAGSYPGSTIGAPSSLFASCGGDADGAEVVHRFSSAAGGQFCASTSGSSFDTVLHIRSSCNEALSEFGCDDDGAGAGASRLEFEVDPGGTAFLIVDGYAIGAAGNYALEITEGPCDGEVVPGGSCEGEQPLIELNLPAEGQTFGAQSGNTGSCRGGIFDPDPSGEEVIYRFEAPADGAYCVSSAGSAYDTVVYVRGACEDLGSELACNDDSDGLQGEVDVQLTAGEDYFLFLDGYNGASFGAYQLLVYQGACGAPPPVGEDCDNRIDDDGDFQIDCDDVDCAGDPACGPVGAEDCDNRIDDDGDFQIDCNDIDCAEDPACAPANAEDCDNRVDDDGDFQVDCDDLDCAGDPACEPEPAAACAFAAIDFAFSGRVYEGSTVGAPQDQSGSCNGSGPERVYLFTPAAGRYCLDTTGSSYDTVLYVRTECEDGQSEVSCDDDGGAGLNAQLEFEAEPGESYYIFVDGAFIGSSGDFQLSIREGGCDEEAPAEICDNFIDDDGDFARDCDDPDCAEDPACAPAVEICDNFIDDDGDFARDCDDPDCAEDPACAPAVEICDNFIDDDGDFERDCDDPDCAADPACEPPAGAACELLEQIWINDPGIYQGFNVRAPNSEEGSCPLGEGGREVVYRFEPVVAGPYCLNTEGSDYDTVLYVRSSCEEAETEIACDDDSALGVASELELLTEPGGVYYVFVDAYDSFDEGRYQLRVSEGPCL